MRAQLLCDRLQGRLLGEDRLIRRLSPLHTALVGDMALVIWPTDIRAAKKTQASLLVMDMATAADHADDMPCSIIAVDDLYETVMVLKQIIDKQDEIFFLRNEYVVAKFIDPSARIHQTACIGRARIGAGVVIDPFVVIHDDVTIGERTFIGAHTVIGSDAFVPYGNFPSRILPSLGSVAIAAHVRIGASCTIDRGLIGVTSIADHSLLDNMIHIGHDVVVGKNVVIAAQSGIAGGARVHDHVTLGGQVGIKPGVSIGEGVRISGKSMVHCDIKKHEIWSGNPSMPHAIYLRSYARTRREFKDKHR